jgi:hypothetical protein
MAMRDPDDRLLESAFGATPLNTGIGSVRVRTKEAPNSKHQAPEKFQDPSTKNEPQLSIAVGTWNLDIAGTVSLFLGFARNRGRQLWKLEIQPSRQDKRVVGRGTQP